MRFDYREPERLLWPTALSDSADGRTQLPFGPMSFGASRLRHLKEGPGSARGSAVCGLRSKRHRHRDVNRDAARR